MKRLKHIGVDAMLAERRKLVSNYLEAKAKVADDKVKTDHGVNAEALLRDWLNAFLPKRFTAAKGYIITRNLEFEGNLEEWDVLIYDALESPVLFYKDADKRERPAVPIEYVRGVLEVKASLNPKNAKLAAKKILRLQQFMGHDDSPAYPMFLCEPFLCGAVFFETAVKDLKTYRQALDALTAVLKTDPPIPFLGALVLSSQRQPEHSGYLRGLCSDTPVNLGDVFEYSSAFQYSDGRFGRFGTEGYYVNAFQMFIFDLLAALRGTLTNRASSFYGIDFENTVSSRLFH